MEGIRQSKIFHENKLTQSEMMIVHLPEGLRAGSDMIVIYRQGEKERHFFSLSGLLFYRMLTGEKVKGKLARWISLPWRIL